MARGRVSLVVLLFLLAGTAALARGAPPAPAQAPGNPLAGVRLFVDHDSPSWHQWRVYRHRGRRGRAALVWKIAREPKALWVGRFTRPHFRKKVRRLIVAARRQGAVPVLTVMRAVSDRCGPGYTAGGPAEDARTRAWYRRLGRTLGHSRVVIAYEPDSLAARSTAREEPPRRPAPAAPLRRGRPLAEPERHDLHRGGGVGLGAGEAHGAPAARGGGREGARLHAQRDPPGLDAGEHPARPEDLAPHRRQALRRQHRRERPWPRALPALERAEDHGLVQPRDARARPAADHQHVEPDGRRVPVDQPPGIRPALPGPKIAWYTPRALAYARHATRWESPPRGTRFGYRKRYPFSVFAGSR